MCMSGSPGICQSYYGVQGYSDKGVLWMVGVGSPGMIRGLSQLHWHMGILRERAGVQGTTMESLVTYLSKLECVLYKAPLDFHELNGIP